MRLLFISLLFLLPVIICAQTVQLRGKVIDINKQPVKNLSIRFTSFGDAVTTGSGEFLISIPESVNSVDVVITDENVQILYPVDAKIPVPSDPNFISTIIVSGNNISGKTSMDESIVKYMQLESLLKDVGTTNSELKAFLEKFIELESKRLEISEVKLREEFERKDRKDAIFAEFSPVLKEYIIRIKNLKTNFEMNYELAFVSNPSVEYLNNAIRAYNPVFDTIYYNNNKWKNNIATVWDAVLAESFASSVSYMIDEVHIPYILQLNECIKTINEIRLKIVSDEEKSEELKKEVRTKVSTIMKSLDIKIPILENRFNELLTRLQNSETE
jgi:hypothetical protein